MPLLPQEGFDDRFFRPRDHVSADQLAVLAGGVGAGIDSGSHRADVAADERRDISAADLHLAGQGDVGRLAHRVGGCDGGDQALGFDQAEGFVKSKDVLKALTVFDALGKELAGAPGEPARKRAEEIFGWCKTIGGLARARFVGRWKIKQQTEVTGAAYNLLRMARLAPCA